MTPIVLVVLSVLTIGAAYAEDGLLALCLATLAAIISIVETWRN